MESSASSRHYLSLMAISSWPHLLIQDLSDHLGKALLLLKIIFLRYSLHTIKFTHLSILYKEFWQVYIPPGSNNYHSQNIKDFHYPQKFPCADLSQLAPQSKPQATMNMLSSSRIDLSFLEFHITEVYTMYSFVSIFFHIIFLRFIHVIAYRSSLLLWIAK